MRAGDKSLLPIRLVRHIIILTTGRTAGSEKVIRICAAKHQALLSRREQPAKHSKKELMPANKREEHFI